MTKTPLVIKIGGAGLADSKALQALLEVVSQLQQTRACVLVHGGGSLVDEWMGVWRRTVIKHNGLRITPPEDMPVIAGALAGTTNTQLVAAANYAGLKAFGMSLLDGHWCHLELDSHRGAVGTPVPSKSDGAILRVLLQENYVPVICSIGQGADASLLNVNADLAAATVAVVLKADLLLLTDVPSILTGDGETIHEVDAEEAKRLIDNNVVHGGMRIKLEAALQAASFSRRTTAVAGWAQPEQLTAVLTGSKHGTRILV